MRAGDDCCEGDFMPDRPDDDEVILFTPETGFTIEKLAKTIVQMMRDMDMDAHVNLPTGEVMEIDRHCTVKDIVKGYKEFIARQLKSVVPSNRNDKK